MTAVLVNRTSQELNFEWDKGSTFRYSIPWTTGKDRINQAPVDLTGATAKAEFRDAGGALLLTLSTTNGGIVLEPDSEAGVVQLYISAADLAGFGWSLAYYDLDITFANGDVRKLFRGTFQLFDEQTL